ncbi:hypothetical protein F4780DRAFT_15642 [Xylariomycetidae sp. FL0641]|nr:hypothetical protein F4780DRAFT_15642 [Xylariomycetidae sp. FL0641]
MPKSAKKQRQAVDYRERWPTQQTLVESRAQLELSEGRTGRRKSLRIQALEAVSAPLLWINMKLEDWQEGIDHRKETIQARKRRHSSASSMPEGSSAPEWATGQRQPGKSTHPYDTGVEKPSGEQQEEAANATTHTHSAQNQSLPEEALRSSVVSR